MVKFLSLFQQPFNCQPTSTGLRLRKNKEDAFIFKNCIVKKHPNYYTGFIVSAFWFPFFHTRVKRCLPEDLKKEKKQGRNTARLH